MKKILLAIVLALTMMSAIWADDLGDGLAAYAKKNYAVAIAKFRLSAAQGNALAQFNLGVIYHFGKGVVQDYAEAVKWYKLSAAQGHASAPYNLGVMYYDGQGVVQDYAEAVKWYKLAAAQGFAIAQSNLGVMYEIGKGVVQDYTRAHMWFSLASAVGNKNAVKGRDLVAAKMTPQQIAEAQKLARECQARNFKNCD